MSVRRLAPKELQPASFAFSRREPRLGEGADREISGGPPGVGGDPDPVAGAGAADGWVSEAAIRAVADLLDMPYIRVLEVATFYTMFQLQPVGKKAHVQVCGTTPCRLRGADDLIEVCQSRIHHDPFHCRRTAISAGKRSSASAPA